MRDLLLSVLSVLLYVLPSAPVLVLSLEHGQALYSCLRLRALDHVMLAQLKTLQQPLVLLLLLLLQLLLLRLELPHFVCEPDNHLHQLGIV